MVVQAWTAPNIADRALTDFRTNITQGAARPNLFMATIRFPQGVIDVAGTDLVPQAEFLVKAAALPASNMGSIEVPYMGMQFKVAGDRTFDPWTITVINDTNFNIRGAFERWANFINTSGARSGMVDPGETVGAAAAAGGIQVGGYTRQMSVYQLVKAPLDGGGPAVYSVDGANLVPAARGYQLYGCWPSNVSSIDLAYDANDQVEEFTVELQVSWWESQNIQASGDADAAGDSGSVFSIN